MGRWGWSADCGIYFTDDGMHFTDWLIHFTDGGIYLQMVEYILQMVEEYLRIGGIILQMVENICGLVESFYRWWKTFADCFMRVLACEEDEDENSPPIATRWFVFRRSKGINRI